jgi:hypothetical protein
MCMSSDGSNSDLFTEEFLENISDDTDSGNNEDNTVETKANLTLEVNLTFPTWKAAFDHITLSRFFCS